MKKSWFLCAFRRVIPVLCIGLFSFSGSKGGDLFALYLNGSQVHQQFVLADQRVKTIEINASGENDKIEVLYSHCGHTGTNRVLTLRNAKNEVVKQLRFQDGDDKSLMGFYSRDVAGNRNMIKIFYSSKELPDGKLLAALHWREQGAIARR